MSYINVPIESLIPPPTEINNSHKEYSVAIAIIVLGIITCLTVLARLTQRWKASTIGLDDYAIFPALLLYIAWTAMAAWFTLNSGIGKPLGDITYGEFITFYKGVFVAAWMYPAMSASIRVSVLLFYRRIFAKGSPYYSGIIWTLLALQAVYVIIFEITPGFSCHPLKDAWEPMKRYTSCSMLYIDATIALYSVSMAFDVILLVFPIYAVSKLQMRLKKRLGVLLIFFLGACSCIAAAYKLGIFADESHNWTPTDPNWFTYQASFYMPPQYNVYGKIFWIPTQVEPTVALIGTSLPSMLAVYSAASLEFSKIRSNFIASRRGSDSSKRSKQTGFRRRTPPSGQGEFPEPSGSKVELHNVSSQPSVQSERAG